MRFLILATLAATGCDSVRTIDAVKDAARKPADTGKQSTAVPDAKPIIVNSYTLDRDYQSGPFAESTYTGKLVSVDGHVESVKVVDGGAIVVLKPVGMEYDLEEGGRLTSGRVACHFKSAADAASFRTSEPVKIVGVCRGKQGGRVTVTDCRKEL